MIMDTIYLNLPSETKTQFKAMCKSKKLSMREWFLLRSQSEIEEFSRSKDGTKQ